jgi:hypothetical protein
MKVTVYFTGICVHINTTLTGPLLQSFSRVVLPNCSNGLNVDNKRISPHIATLHIPAQYVDNHQATNPGLAPVLADNWSWQMNGVQLALQNVPLGVTLAKSYCLPSLTKTVAAEGVNQLSLNDVLFDGSAACVFEILGGTLDSLKHREALLGKLTVETDHPQLRVKLIWDETETFISLQPATIDGTTYDPVIFLSNTGDGHDGDADFLLHYRVTTFMPDKVLTPKPDCPLRPATPDEIADLRLCDNVGEGLTIGCSNSVYP